MANYKFTKDVKSAILSELEGIVRQEIVLGSDNIRAVCKKVGISHTTFYRQMRRYRVLVTRGEPFTDIERELVDFGHQVDALVRQLRYNRGQWNLGALKKILEKMYTEDAKYEQEYHRGKAKKRQHAIQRKKEKEHKSLEQQTDQLTQGVGYFEFISEKSQKNM